MFKMMSKGYILVQPGFTGHMKVLIALFMNRWQKCNRYFIKTVENN